MSEKNSAYCGKEGTLENPLEKKVPIYIGDNNYKTLTVFIYLRINKKKLTSDFTKDKKFEVCA